MKDFSFDATWGSSPLARGLRRRAPERAGDRGIIPARAGFTLRRRWWHLGGEDHPRSRGVYIATRLPGLTQTGSSPLARGLPERVGDDRGGRGIIPARAGFTPFSHSPKPSIQDHPRSRGVYGGHGCGIALQPGSSPLARGLHAHPTGAGGGGRIIPARAGFTAWWRPTSGTPTDHPRSRGVYWTITRTGAWTQGSSPLARGLLQAYVQTTLSTVDHPRSRGVYG